MIGLGLSSAVLLRVATGGDDPASSIPSTLLFGTALLALCWASGRREVRLPRARWVAAGLAGGAVLVAGAVVGRPVAIHPPADGAALAVWAPVVVWVAVAEEAVLRGALFNSIEERWGVASALLATTAAFGLIHLPLYGPGAMPIDLAAGLWLGGLRVLSGGVTAPAVAHVVADLASAWLG